MDGGRLDEALLTVVSPTQSVVVAAGAAG